MDSTYDTHFLGAAEPRDNEAGRQFTYTFDSAVQDWLNQEYGEQTFGKILKLPLEAFEKKQKRVNRLGGAGMIESQRHDD